MTFGVNLLKVITVPNMKNASKIVAILLGLFFVAAGVNFFLPEEMKLFIPPSPPEGSQAAAFIGAIGGSGYLAAVKVVEIVGGLALLCGCTRRLGIVLIGAVLFNIVAFHVAFFGWGSVFALNQNALEVLAAVIAVLFLTFTHRLCCCLSGRGCCSKDGSGSCCSGCNCCASGSCGEKAESSSCCSTQSSDKKSGGCGCG